MNSQQTYIITEFDTISASDALWDKYFDFIEPVDLETSPDYPLQNRELRRKRLVDDNPYYKSKRWFVIENSEIIAYLYAGYVSEKSPQYATNKHVGIVHIVVRKDLRRRGIAKELFPFLKDDATAHGCTILEFWVSHTAAKLACETLDTELAHKHYVNKLLIKDVNCDLMAKWIDDAQMRTADVKLEFFESVPEKDIHEFTKLYTETINQAPWGSDTEVKVTPETRRYSEQDLKKKGYVWTTIVSREQNGEISGLTEIYYNPQEPYFVQQELTGVRDKYRLRGLGKWLKARMLFFIKENYPEVQYISTGNAIKNEAMLSVNRRMGFRETEVFHLYRYRI